MNGDADANSPDPLPETPAERRARELRERMARAAEMPNSEVTDLQPPVTIRDYGELMDGGSRRFLLRDQNGHTASVEWNYSIGGKHRGRVLQFQIGEKRWTPLGNEELHRIQKWIGEAVLRGDFPPEYADDLADFAKYAE